MYPALGKADCKCERVLSSTGLHTTCAKGLLQESVLEKYEAETVSLSPMVASDYAVA